MNLFARNTFVLSAPISLGLLAGTLVACGGAASHTPSQIGAEQSVSHPMAFQDNAGWEFAEYLAPCGYKLGPMSAGPDGNEWFSSQATCNKHVNRGSIGRIDTVTGEVTQWIIGRARGAQPGDVVSNVGYLWVADLRRYGFAQGYVLQVDTSGQQIAIIDIGPITPDAMTLGPDGNVWFAGGKGFNRQKAAVGYITPENGVTSFQFKKSLDVYPTSISAGPDNDVWVSDEEHGVIYQVGPSSGAITPFNVGGHPAYLTHDSKLLEFSDSETAQISTMNGKGVVKTYPAPAGQFPGLLARKPDGTVAYVDNYNRQIGTFDGATGTYGPEVSPGVGGGVSYIANGPDGNLWFDTSGGVVGAYLKYILTTTPASLQWNGGASGCSPQTLTAAETNYSGSFTATSANPSIATITQTGNSSFSVVPGATGDTTINVADGQRNDVNVQVSVTTSCAH